MSRQLRRHAIGSKLELCSLEIDDDNPVQEFLLGLQGPGQKCFARMAQRLCLAPEAYLKNDDYWKALAPYTGLHEMRDHQHGLRYYGFRDGDKLIILCAAGDKDEQSRDIRRAEARMWRYKELKAAGQVFTRIEETGK